MNINKKEYRFYSLKRKPGEPYFPKGTVHETERVELCQRIFVWDKAKNDANVVSHGIDFYTAVCVFNDEDRLEEDNWGSGYESRQQIIGEPVEPSIQGHPIATKCARPRATMGVKEGILFVVATESADAVGEITRIISARPAEKNEAKAYFDSKYDS